MKKLISMVVFLFIGTAVYSQSTDDGAQKFQGAYLVTQSNDVQRVLAFAMGGTVSMVGAGEQRGGYTSGLGNWQQSGPSQVVARIVNFNFDQESGAPIGTARVRTSKKSGEPYVNLAIKHPEITRGGPPIFANLGVANDVENEDGNVAFPYCPDDSASGSGDGGSGTTPGGGSQGGGGGGGTTPTPVVPTLAQCAEAFSDCKASALSAAATPMCRPPMCRSCRAAPLFRPMRACAAIMTASLAWKKPNRLNSLRPRCGPAA